MKIFKNSLVLGKFWPFTKGHQYLIDTAISKSEVVHVIITHNSSQNIPGELRYNAIKETYNNTNVKDKFIYILLAMFSIINVYSFAKIDKDFNNSSIILESFILIATYLLNSFIYKDKLTSIKISGIFLIIFGHYLIK